jgi:hypothetical protein
MSAIAPLLEFKRKLNGQRQTISEAVDVAHRLSPESHVERNVCDERGSVRQRLTYASASDRSADKLLALGKAHQEARFELEGRAKRVLERPPRFGEGRAAGRSVGSQRFSRL